MDFAPRFVDSGRRYSRPERRQKPLQPSYRSLTKTSGKMLRADREMIYDFGAYQRAISSSRVTVGGSFALFKEKLVMAWNNCGCCTCASHFITFCNAPLSLSRTA